MEVPGKLNYQKSYIKAVQKNIFIGFDSNTGKFTYWVIFLTFV